MLEADLDLIKSTADEAGEIAKSFWSGDNKVWEKGPDDPVSEADLAVDTFLKERLLAARPDYGWLSEETGDTKDRLSRGSVFVVDPIDGTRAFIAGRSTWAVSVGLVTDGKPVAGVVAMPAREKTYCAVKGGGATLNGMPISATGTAEVSKAHVLANKLTFDPHHWTRVPHVAERAFRPSLAYRICLVAEGRFDAMMTFRDCWEWDIAAGAIIAAEAGAVVSDRDGKDIRFNVASAQSSGMIIAPSVLHSELMKLRASAT